MPNVTFALSIIGSYWYTFICAYIHICKWGLFVDCSSFVLMLFRLRLHIYMLNIKNLNTYMHMYVSCNNARVDIHIYIYLTGYTAHTWNIKFDEKILTLAQQKIIAKTFLCQPKLAFLTCFKWFKNRKYEK